VDGRQHPVDIFYLAEPARDYIQKTVETVLQIHKEESTSAGDILCFLPSGEDIDQAIRLAEEIMDQQQQQQQASKNKRSRQQSIDFLPLYGTLPYQMQARVFQSQSTGRRRAIFATNM